MFQALPNQFLGKVIPEMQETLGELIRRRMNEVGIKNNSELARLIGRSDAYVGDLINDRGKTKSGKYQPRTQTISKLSHVLRIPESEILNALGFSATEDAVVIDVSEDVKLNLLDGQDYNEEERAVFGNDVGVAVEIAKRRIEEKRKEKAG